MFTTAIEKVLMLEKQWDYIRRQLKKCTKSERFEKLRYMESIHLLIIRILYEQIEGR